MRNDDSETEPVVPNLDCRKADAAIDKYMMLSCVSGFVMRSRGW